MQESSSDLALSPLVDRVRRHERVREIERKIREGRRRIDLTGLKGSSPAFLVGALHASLEVPVVVCCADLEAARDACSDLETIGCGRVELFPEKDIFPQRFELRESLTVRGQRNACLDLVLRDEADVVVTSVTGFLEKTAPVDVLTRHARDVTTGDTIDLDALIDHLVAVGYERGATVDEIGQFAVRGAIIDIFDPSWAQPARLELADEQVESIRAFDIDSQRSIGHLDRVHILPATGVLVNEHSLRTLESALRQAAFEDDVIRQILHEVEHHRFSYLLRRYAPALGMTGSLLDYFRRRPVVFFWGEESIGRGLDALAAEFERVVELGEDEYPPLGLSQYIHPPDYYAARCTSALHLWDVPDEGPSGRHGDVVRFRTAEHPAVLGKLDSMINTIRRLAGKGGDVHIFSESAVQRERLADMLEEDEHLVHLPVGWMTSGFVWEDAQLCVLTDHQIFHRVLPRPMVRRKTRRAQGYRQDELQIGDFVVHVDYGIGRYLGLERLAVGGADTECLVLRYHSNDRIFVPVDQMPLVEKYIGKEGVVPSLDRLGSARWQRTKTRTKKALEDVAREMIDMYAKRELAEGHAFGSDTQWQQELEASFPFEETRDQLRATGELKQDMEADRPMDRLVCGDVGFGKTEVAIRAAFKAVNDGQQVGVLVPTTVLALQHYKTFSERMKPFPVRVEMLSRFRTAAEQKRVVAGLAGGAVDVVIGTHRLLSKDVAFRDLGLLIVDEEHRFGVRSKEKLKAIKRSVDIMSMTATPIPRTLYMALSGLRPISVIDTPPRNRHPVKTDVLPFDEGTIARAIRYEVSRGGQVFFVHNRVESIASVRAFLEKLTPEVRFGVAHGQMGEKDLERVIIDFLEKKFDVLVTTTIIESGLDFPDVNTIIINRADRFGLAELYQLRGRVGRRERQAYAYLFVPRNYAITEKASKRLQAMEEFEELGSGYRLAMRDLEIRGAGNVLGVEQHGQMVAVGFDLYCKMLKEAVEKLRGMAKEELPPSRVEAGLPTFLPVTYVEDANERMATYKRLAAMTEAAEVDALEGEVIDRFGPLPVEAANLLELTRIKLDATTLGVALVRVRPGIVTMDWQPRKALDPRRCAQLVETFQGRVLFKSGENFGLTLSLTGGAQPLGEAKKLLKTALGM